MVLHDHPDTLISMVSLAAMYRKQGRWEEAEKLEVQVMERATRPGRRAQSRAWVRTRASRIPRSGRCWRRGRRGRRRRRRQPQERREELGEDAVAVGGVGGGGGPGFVGFRDGGKRDSGGGRGQAGPLRASAGVEGRGSGCRAGWGLKGGSPRWEGGSRSFGCWPWCWTKCRALFR